MAFPTTSVLDDFNRANEEPLTDSGKWSGIVSGTPGHFTLVSNSIFDHSGTHGTGSAAQYRNNANYGPGAEAYVTLTSVWANNNSDFWFWMHGRSEGTSGRDGYVAYAYYNGGTWRYKMDRIDNEVATEIRAAQAGPTLGAGDKLGLECSTSGVFTWYYKASAGSWGAASGLSTTTDTTYTSGHIGVSKGFNDTTSVLDDFGGGTLIGASSFKAAWARGANVVIGSGAR